MQFAEDIPPPPEIQMSSSVIVHGANLVNCRANEFRCYVEGAYLEKCNGEASTNV